MTEKKWTLIDTNTRILSLIIIFILVGIGIPGVSWLFYDAFFRNNTSSFCLISIIIALIVSALLNVYLLLYISKK